MSDSTNHPSLHPFDAEALSVEALGPSRRREAVSAYLDDALSPAAARHVTTWLEAHPEALREVERLRRTWDLLELYPEEPVPAAFAAEVLARAGIERPVRGKALSWAGRIGLLAAAAAVLVAAGVALWEGGRRTSVVERADVDLLEEVPADLLADVDLLLSLTDDEFDGVLLADPEAE